MWLFFFLFLVPFINGQLDSLPNGLEAIATDSNALRCALINTGQCTELERKDCGCSCNPTCKLKQKRFRDCCASIGMPEGCRNLCNYNPGKNLFCQAPQCWPEMKKLMYCASDTTNTAPNQACCARPDADMNQDCQIFCKGQSPPIDELTEYNYYGCLMMMHTIMRCHYDNLPPANFWRVGARPQIDSDPMSEPTRMIIEQLAKNACSNEPNAAPPASDYNAEYVDYAQ